MDALILAAGEGTRMRPLTLERPKPFIEICGHPLVEHIVHALPNCIERIIMVVGYKEEMIRAYCGDHFCGHPVVYVTQHIPKGTADAMILARPFLSAGKFLIVLGDSLLDKDSLTRMISHDLAVLAHPHEHPERFGVIETSSEGILTAFNEKPEHPKTNLVSTGAMVLDERIFNYEAGVGAKGETYIPTMVAAMARDYPVKVETASFWMDVGYPEDIPKATEALRARGGCV